MLELKHISRKYDNVINKEVQALDDINIVFPDTVLFFITGATDCGKTTLFNIIGGLDRPTFGEVWFNNFRIDDKPETSCDKMRGSKISLLHQSNNLFENMTVEENLKFPLRLKKADKEGEDALSELISEFDIDTLLKKNVSELNSGEKQRVAAALSLKKPIGTSLKIDG